MQFYRNEDVYCEQARAKRGQVTSLEEETLRET